MRQRLNAGDDLSDIVTEVKSRNIDTNLIALVLTFILGLSTVLYSNQEESAYKTDSSDSFATEQTTEDTIANTDGYIAAHNVRLNAYDVASDVRDISRRERRSNIISSRDQARDISRHVRSQASYMGADIIHDARDQGRDMAWGVERTSHFSAMCYISEDEGCFSTIPIKIKADDIAYDVLISALNKTGEIFY